MKGKQQIDLSDVKMTPVRTGENNIEAEVETKHGVARLTLDLSTDEYVGLTIVLPSGNEYKSKIDSWADDTVDDDSTLRLAAAAVVQCFEKEIQKRN